MDYQDRTGDDFFEDAVEEKVESLALAGVDLRWARERAEVLAADLEDEADGYPWLNADEKRRVRRLAIRAEAYARYVERLEAGDPSLPGGGATVPTPERDGVVF